MRKAESRRGRIILLIIAASLLFGVLSGLRACSSILISSISDWTGMSYGTVSIAFSVMNIVLALSCPLIGVLTLRIRAIHIMIVGAILGGIGFLGTAFCSTFPALIIFMGIIFGLGAGALCYSIVFMATVPVIGEKYSIVLGGIINASQGAVSMILSPLLGAVTDSFGTQVCLIGIGILSFLTIPLCFLFLPKKSKENSNIQSETLKEKREPIITSIKSSLSLPIALLMILAMLTYGFCDGGMTNHLYEVTQGYSVSTTVSSLLFACFCFFSMVGSIVGGIICSHVKNSKFVYSFIFLVVGAVVIIAYLIPAGYVSAFINTSIYGLCMGIAAPALTAILLKYVPMEKFSAIYSLLAFFMMAGYGLDSILGGLLYDIFGNFVIVDIISVGLGFAVVILFTLSGIKDRKKEILQTGRIL